MKLEYICPNCEADLCFEEGLELVTCGECHTKCRVNYDSDYVNGRQVDNTTISIEERGCPPY